MTTFEVGVVCKHQKLHHLQNVGSFVALYENLWLFFFKVYIEKIRLNDFYTKL